jgi:OmpR family response regulator RpaB
MHNLLLIDDDQRLGDLLSEYFQQFDMQVDHALRPSDGFSKLEKNDYELVILDVMLPEMDGFEVCKTIRKSSDIPILMLTARGEVTDRIIGIEIGADDYLAKPFEPRELVVRIRNILKRTKNTINNNKIQVLQFDGLEIDKELRQVSVNADPIILSSMEYNLLVLLADKPNKIFSRDEILNYLKGIDADIFSRAVDIQISRLRQKLKPCNYIKTIRGSGYTFAAKTL